MIARRNDRFSSFLSGYYSLGLIVPWAIVPTVLLLKILHIQNTQLGLIAVTDHDSVANVAEAMTLAAAKGH